jgi:hypothetical protein
VKKIEEMKKLLKEEKLDEIKKMKQEIEMIKRWRRKP